MSHVFDTMANSKSFLQQIYPVGADDTEAEVDIIALHGLDPLDNPLSCHERVECSQWQAVAHHFRDRHILRIIQETSWSFLSNLAAIEYMWTTSCAALPILYDVSAC